MDDSLRVREGCVRVQHRHRLRRGFLELLHRAVDALLPLATLSIVAHAVAVVEELREDVEVAGR